MPSYLDFFWAPCCWSSGDLTWTFCSTSLVSGLLTRIPLLICTVDIVPFLSCSTCKTWRWEINFCFCYKSEAEHIAIFALNFLLFQFIFLFYFILALGLGAELNRSFIKRTIKVHKYNKHNHHRNVTAMLHNFYTR